MRPHGEKMSVLMVASSYPRHERDTASIFLQYFAQYLAADGVDVDVLSPHDAAVSAQIIEDGVELHRFKYFPGCPRMLAYGSGILPNIRKYPWLIVQVPFFVSALFIRLLLLARKLKPDVIHAHWILPNGFVAVLAGILLRVPVIVSAHGGDAFGLDGRVSRALKRFTLKYCQAWTANTPQTARAVGGEVDENKLSVIPMGVDTARFVVGDGARLRSNSAGTLVLFVGRLVQKKGVKYLIEAAAELVQRESHRVTLWIVGDGEGMCSLRSQATRLGLAGSVRFFGAIPNHELPDFYAAADLFVAPSIVDEGGDTEGMGVVLLEAMAAGVPVIASRVGGIVDVIQDGVNGVLVEPGDSHALAVKIEDFLRQGRSDAMVHNAMAVVEKEFSWPVVAQRFINLYTSIADAKAGG